jgi:hypothetical protein
MVKKNENFLSLPAMTSDYLFGHADIMAPSNETSGMNTDRRKVMAESNLQRVAMDSIRVKTICAMDQVQEINQHADTNFISFVEYVIQNKEKNENTNCQPYIDEWTQRLIQVGAQQYLGTIKIATTAIAQEVARSPYPPIIEIEPEKSKGLLQRILG